VQFVLSAKPYVCTAFSLVSVLSVHWSLVAPSISFILATMTARQTNNSLAVALSSIVVSSGPGVKCSHEQDVIFYGVFAVWQACCCFIANGWHCCRGKPANFGLDRCSFSQSRGPHQSGCSGGCSGFAKATTTCNCVFRFLFWRWFIILVVEWLGFVSSCRAGFQPSISSSSTQSRTIPLVLPTFVSTFNMPVLALVLSSGHALSGISAQLPSSNVNSLADQLFMMGPGFPPVPAKLVLQIRSGKFVDLSELLVSNLVTPESEPKLMLNGHLVLSPSPKKPCRCIEDITIWTEAVTVLTLILTSSSPHRWKDLKLYKLLVLRIYWQFSRRVWLAYDKAFLKHAAATLLADWSAMNAQLFNFHTTGASLHSYNLGLSMDSSEPAGSSSSRLPCTAWNKGRCTAPHTLCHYYHRCSTCGGAHHSVSCALRPDRKLKSTFSCSSQSPAASSLSSQKAQRQ